MKWRLGKTERGRAGLAFTVVELLVAVSVMTLIILVLWRVFDQTQRALRSNNAQVDVMEGGRSAIDLLSRDLAQMAHGDVLSNINFQVVPNRSPWVYYQQIPTNELRTNVLHELYFISHSNRTFAATAYRVLTVSSNFQGGVLVRQTNFASEGVGFLARFSFPLRDYEFALYDPARTIVLLTRPQDFANYQFVADGIVHFRVTAFDSLGQVMTNLVNGPDRYVDTRIIRSDIDAGPSIVAENSYLMTNSALPAYVEVELGVLEPQRIERWRSLPTPESRSNFLHSSAAQVQLFHQRIPIRNARHTEPLP
jgi:hypothetical protein